MTTSLVRSFTLCQRRLHITFLKNTEAAQKYICLLWKFKVTSLHFLEDFLLLKDNKMSLFPMFLQCQWVVAMPMLVD